MEKEKRKELAEQAYHQAFELDQKYGCCPQCVLVAIKDTVGGISNETIKASHGLSGGGGLMGTGACGGLTGGLIALSTRRGRDADKLDRGPAISNFQVGRKLVEKFQEEFGGVTCEHLQKVFTGRTWDMWKPEEYQAFTENRGDQCARATALATKWAVELM